MARFDKLEIGGKGTGPPEQVPVNPEVQDENAWMRKADDNRRSGMYENALRFYSRALELDKSIVVAWVGQVQMLTIMREYPQAELWARKALELFPGQPELTAGRAQASLRLGNHKLAIELSDASLAQSGDSAYRWQVRGEIMAAQRQRADEHCFDRAEQANADWLVPLESALIYLFYRMPAKAILRVKRAMEKQSGAWYVWYIMGQAQFDAGMASQATLSFQRSLELSPGNVAVQQRLAELNQSGWSLRRTLRRWVGGS